MYVVSRRTWVLGKTGAPGRVPHSCAWRPENPSERGWAFSSRLLRSELQTTTRVPWHCGRALPPGLRSPGGIRGTKSHWLFLSFSCPSDGGPRVLGDPSRGSLFGVRGPARQQIPSAPKSNSKSQQTGSSWWPEIWGKFRVSVGSHCGYSGEITVRGPGASLHSPAEMSPKPRTRWESLRAVKGQLVEQLALTRAHSPPPNGAEDGQVHRCWGCSLRTRRWVRRLRKDPSVPKRGRVCEEGCKLSSQSARELWRRLR